MRCSKVYLIDLHMEKSADHFTITLEKGALHGEQLLIEPVQTTDGVPIYNCLLDEKPITQLRQSPDGGWVQVWGALDKESVQVIGEALERHHP